MKIYIKNVYTELRLPPKQYNEMLPSSASAIHRCDEYGDVCGFAFDELFSGRGICGKAPIRKQASIIYNEITGKEHSDRSSFNISSHNPDIVSKYTWVGSIPCISSKNLRACVTSAAYKVDLGKERRKQNLRQYSNPRPRTDVSSSYNGNF